MSDCRILLFATLVAAVSGAVRAADVDFNRDVAPVLIRRCLECHGETTASGKLILSRRDGAMVGGDSGPGITPGNLDESHLFQRVAAGEMPPEKQGRSQKLPDAEIAVLKRWIESGAKWPEGRTLDLYEQTTDVRGGRDWWSFQPVRRPPVPASPDTVNPIDAFIRGKLAQENFTPAPAAERRLLIRRLYVDLIGLPPTAEEIEAFVADTSPEAYEKIVDRLLDSPHFGERWARYWLDVVRFAETCGYERDQEKPGAWKYRDWVIRAINGDMPYDRFVTEQLAGDELPDRSEQSVIATGFLRLGTWNDEPNDADEYKYERLEDMVHATGTAFLGLTIKCARCHDHKFDPIPHADYYRVANAFWPGPIEPRQRELLGGPTKEELSYDVLGWTDTRRPPPLHLLKKGDHRQPLAAVTPGQLTLVPALAGPIVDAPVESKTTQRRLQLAKWIVDPKNPLTARVYVNRLWQRHFGQGLVRSSNNFGFKGDLPTHPELLDWLADELVRIGWKSKPLHKLMVMSETYRQSSLHPQQDDYSRRDGANRLWWRAERRRLDAESLRDAILVASGQLDPRMYGPSFKPDISPEALEGLSRKSGAWQPSPPEQQRRRSVYMYTQRSLLPPLMTTFDLCDTTEPCGQRDVSIVAPQALALLNNPFVHEQSQALADRIVERDPSKQVIAVWQIVFGRNPTSLEADLAGRYLQRRVERTNVGLDEPSESHIREVSVPEEGIVLHLAADQGVVADKVGRVIEWKDQSKAGHHATQDNPEFRPLLVAKAVNDLPALRLSGKRQFLNLAGQVVTSQQFAIFAVVSDQASEGHREILSNWRSDGNVLPAVFFGLTGESTVRLTDFFAPAGQVRNRKQHFLLSAHNGPSDATVHQNDLEIARRPNALDGRKLDTPWVIGTQGNIGHEDWNGDIAELIVYDRALSPEEQTAVRKLLMKRYNLPSLAVPPRRFTPEERALASLCHALLNTNEFLFVD